MSLVYRWAAGGSQELPIVRQVHRGHSEMIAMDEHASWVIRGSRLSTPKAFGGCKPIDVPTDKAAPLQARVPSLHYSVAPPCYTHAR